MSGAGSAVSRRSAPLVRCRLVSGTGPVRQALDELKRGFVKAGVAAPLADAAQIILAEVLNNVVEHAYLFEEGHPIDLAIWLRADGIWCEIGDEGRPIPGGTPPRGAMPTIDTSKPDTLPEGGFGWALVHRMTRELRYVRRDGHNHLEFLIPS